MVGPNSLITKSTCQYSQHRKSVREQRFNLNLAKHTFLNLSFYSSSVKFAQQFSYSSPMKNLSLFHSSCSSFLFSTYLPLKTTTGNNIIRNQHLLISYIRTRCGTKFKINQRKHTLSSKTNLEKIHIKEPHGNPYSITLKLYKEQCTISHPYPLVLHRLKNTGEGGILESSKSKT